MTKRLDSIELLRCVLMFLIIGQHAFLLGVMGDCWDAWTLLFTAFVAWHVDAFIAITGWFGAKFSPSKIIKLIGLMAWYSLLSVGWMCVADRGSLSLKNIGISGGWFGSTYLMLLCVIPFVNAAIERLSAMPRRMAVFAWSIAALAYSLSWFPSHLLLPFSPCGVSGQSLFLFAFIYVTVRLLRTQYDVQKIAKRFFIWACVAFVAVMTLCGTLALTYRWYKGMPLNGRCFGAWTTCGYDAPHVWLLAIAIVIVFVTKVHLPKWVGNVCCFLGPSMFGVYLMHTTTSFGELLYVCPQKWLMAHVSLHPALVVFLSAVVCFVLCVGADVLRRFLLRGISGPTNRFLSFVDMKWDANKMNSSMGSSMPHEGPLKYW